MQATADLHQQVAEALAAGEQTDTPTLQGLYYQCFGEPCRRRARILYKLQSYLTKRSAQGAEGVPSAGPLPPSTLTMGKSDNFRFKAAFKDKKAIVHSPETRYVTAGDLSDADVPALRAAGRGHFIEPIPGREKEGEAAVKKLAEPAKEEAAELPGLHVNKHELQAIYLTELGQKPAAELTVEELRKTIEKHRIEPK